MQKVKKQQSVSSIKSKGMQLSGRTPSPASEFNENKINSLTVQILKVRNQQKSADQKYTKKKSMMPQHLKEYKSQKKERKPIPVAQIALESIRKPEEPETLPNRSARLNRTRSILAAQSKPLDVKNFKSKKLSMNAKQDQYASMTERVKSQDSFQNNSSHNQNSSPRRRVVEHTSWKVIDSPYRIEPYLQKIEPDSTPRESQPKQFTPAFLRVYGQQNVINLSELGFENQK